MSDKPEDTKIAPAVKSETSGVTVRPDPALKPVVNKKENIESILEPRGFLVKDPENQKTAKKNAILYMLSILSKKVDKRLYIFLSILSKKVDKRLYIFLSISLRQ